MKVDVPAVSIIIPMYNAEKYIGECLDSILAQTFQNFEVIVVDDCSTDNSCAVVERYQLKFGDKLQLVHSEKNFGVGGSVQRNIGIRLSRGEYLFFIDSDDAIIDTTLEEFKKLIEEFKVDMIYSVNHYENTEKTALSDKKMLKKFSTDNRITSPFLLSDNLQYRMNILCEHRYMPFSWNQFIRRDFVVKNEITFPPLRAGTDFIFGFYLICLAKNILCVPNLWYIWRQDNKNSITKASLPVDKLIHRWVDSLFKGTMIIDQLMTKIDFFQEFPDYKHRVYKLLIDYHARRIIPLYAQIPAGQLDSLIRKELSEVKDTTALTAFLFARMNVLNVQLLQAQKILDSKDAQIKKLQAQLVNANNVVKMQPYENFLGGDIVKVDVPAVSIIIPMYNAEKYVGECLDSILAQTFDDYEVIIVDDCSTDNSRAIVESYMPKFNRDVERLKLICSEVNSGGASVPRNKGLKFARGEYIMFVDSDDAITPTALEELYPTAKKFNADALYCEKYYEIPEGEKFTTDKNFLKERTFFNMGYDPISKPTIVSNDIVQRVQDFVSYKFSVTSWSYFLRKEFILRHDLRFPATKYAEDNFLTMFIVCLAKSLVRVPNKKYIYRIRDTSLAHDLQPLNKFVRWYTDHLFKGVDIVRKFSNEVPALRERPDLQYKLFEFFRQRGSDNMAYLYAQTPAWELENLIVDALDRVDDKTTLAAFLFAQMNLVTLKVYQQNKFIDEFVEKSNMVASKQQEKIEYYEKQMDYYRKAMDKLLNKQ